MSPYSGEELVSGNFILNEHLHGIINIVDATNIERNLYLTMQLMEQAAFAVRLIGLLLGVA